MTSLAIPEGYGQLTFGGYLGGDTACDWSTSIGFLLGSATDLPTVVIADVESACFELLATLSDSVRVTQGTLLVNRVGQPLSRLDFPLNAIGGESQPSSPPQVAVLVRKSTGLAGRQHRGRMYLPGPLVQDVGAAGTFAGTSTMQVAVDSFVTVLQGNDWIADLMLLHADPLLPPSALLSQPYGLIVESKVATQRRRLER